MKLLIVLFCLLVPSYAILGLEYDRALSKFYKPYYMEFKKALEAEKGLEMAHGYKPHLPKEKPLPHGKGYPHYFPLQTKEKKIGIEVGKEMALHYPLIAKEKIAAEIGKAKFMH